MRERHVTAQRVSDEQSALVEGGQHILPRSASAASLRELLRIIRARRPAVGFEQSTATVRCRSESVSATAFRRRGAETVEEHDGRAGTLADHVEAHRVTVARPSSRRSSPDPVPVPGALRQT